MPYGVEVYNSSGNTVLAYTSRVPRFVQSGTFILSGANTTNTTVTGMINSDSWNVFLVPNTAAISLSMQVALFTDFFSTRMPSNSGNNLVSYWVLRS